MHARPRTGEHEHVYRIRTRVHAYIVILDNFSYTVLSCPVRDLHGQ
jgi:hypothetical protein